MQQTAINKYTLAFSNDSLETEFKKKSITESIGRVRSAILLATIIYLLFFIHDYFANPTNYLPFLINRIIVCSLSLSFYFISFKKVFQEKFIYFSTVLFFVYCAGTIHAIVNGNTSVASVFLVVIFFALVPYNTFKSVAIQNIILLIFFYFSLLFLTELNLLKLLTNTFLFLTFILVILLIFYNKQKVERKNFLLTETIIDKNELLEKDKAKLQNQAILAKILYNSTDPNIKTNNFLQKSLDIILDLPWLNIKSKGSVFITNADGNLEMVADKDLGVLTKTCALVKPGQCLCGKALSRKKLLFNSCVTADHDIRPDGMTPHGHYNVPLMMKGKVLGVLNLYVSHDHQKTEDEVNFLELVSDAMALVVYRHQLEKEREKDVRKIIDQKIIIEKSYNKINESIEYAQRIQNSLLASNNLLEEEFADTSLLYLPKETVSGDFYMARKKSNYIYLVVADCTGHGVPGALVSALGLQELSHIIETSDGPVGEMLDKLNTNLNKLINNDDLIGSDGMDLTLISIDRTNKTISYTGAKGIFYIYQSDELVQLKTDRVSIGQNYKDDFKFTTKTISYQPQDSIHLLSDGLIDQISDVNQKRIGSKRVKELLTIISPLGKEEKQIEISKFITAHKTVKQTDDITLLNLKLC